MQKGYIFAILLLVCFAVFMEFSRFLVFWHELSHALACRLLGGEVIGFEFFIGGRTICRFIKPSFQQILYFSLAGIAGELLLGLILFLTPYLNALGGFVIFRIGFSFLFSAYSTDLKDIGLEFLLALPFRLLIFFASILVFLISAYIYFYFWRKIK
jgi:hypothetical protein